MIKRSPEHLNSFNECYGEHMSVAFKVGQK